MAFDATKAPFPWFGAKSKAAHVVWDALGDVEHYVEPFAGSLAVLLGRPHEANRPYYSETVNDADGLIVNAWRSIQLSPDATAEACSWPPSELDLTARHVRIISGDWSRLVTNGATKTLPVRQGGHCGVFLDPPYADTAGRDGNLYGVDCLNVAHKVREWCLAHGDDPQLRIVLAGFEGEHGTAMTDAGWREVEWFTQGWLSGGMGNTRGRDDHEGELHQQKRERLWLSPHCLRPKALPAQRSLFGEDNE